MKCNDRNKRKFQCGKKVSSACTEYAGWLPSWSDLKLEDCVTIEEAIEEIYHVLDDIRKAINVTDLGRGCIEYPASSSKLNVAMVLAAFEDRLCGNSRQKTNVFVNNEVSVKAIKSNIPSGFVGSEETYTVPYGSHVSTHSQEDADALAINDAREKAQEYANAVGSYSPRIYYSAEKSKEFTRNNCPGNMPCGTVKFTVEAGRFTSTISQNDADSLALKYVEDNGQSYANINGTCKQVYFSKYISEQFYKNDCGEGYGDPDGILYELETGAIISDVSQYDADHKAMEKAKEEGQKMANDFGTCHKLYVNEAVEAFFERDNCDEGYKGKSKLYSIPAGEVESYVSQSDANIKAKKLLHEKGKALIKLEGECIENYFTVKSYVYPAGTANVDHPESAMEGEYIRFRINPKEDFGVNYVTINGNKYDDLENNEGEFVVDKASVIKVYTKSDIKYRVSVKASPNEGGSAIILSGDIDYISGSSCIIEALPDDGYSFDGWYRDGVFVTYSKTHAFVVDKNTQGEYIAVFVKI